MKRFNRIFLLIFPLFWFPPSARPPHGPDSYMMLLPNLTPDGLKILLYGVTSDDPSLFQPVDFFRRMAMVLDIQQKLGIDFTGIRVILYARHGTLSHLAQFDLLLLKRVFKLARVSSSTFLWCQRNISRYLLMGVHFNRACFSNCRKRILYV